MNYQEMTGQESGIWIYKENNHALICNWSSELCSDCSPVIFVDSLVWIGPTQVEDNEWRKVGTDEKLEDWLEDVEIVWDANDDSLEEDFYDSLCDVYECDKFIILAPKGWN